MNYTLNRISYLFGRYAPEWLVYWWTGFRPFKPCAIEFEEMGATEMVLKDGMTVWTHWPPDSNQHAVDLGYDENGNLVGIRIWDRVIKRERSE